MPAKPILIYKLTPSQIALVDRLADADNGVLLDEMDYREVVNGGAKVGHWAAQK